MRTGAWAVDLVHDDHDAHAGRQRVTQHETRLRHRSLECVDDEQRSVGHVEHALDLATEVGMTRSVDDVDLDVLVGNRNVLRQNGDAAFALLVVAVQDSLGNLLVLAEHARRVQQAVDDGRLAVIDVRDDRDVADVFLLHAGTPVVLIRMPTAYGSRSDVCHAGRLKSLTRKNGMPPLESDMPLKQFGTLLPGSGVPLLHTHLCRSCASASKQRSRLYP